MAVAHFNSWEGALQATGLQEQRRPVGWTRERVLEAIRAGPMKEPTDGLRKAAIRLFGSWEEATRAAGRPQDQVGKCRFWCVPGGVGWACCWKRWDGAWATRIVPSA